MFRIACQTIVFGAELKERMESIWKTVAEAGYDGVEVGARHFDMERPEYYRELLDQYRLTLPIIHVGGNFLDKDSIAEQMNTFAKTVDFASRLSCSHIYVSGVFDHNKTVEQYIAESEVYNEMGKRCADQRICFCYHNHDWEIINLMGGMDLLLEHTTPATMMLAPDVGWITVSNADPAAFLEKHFDRVEAVHFKDFKKVRAFTELGTGMVDFPSVAKVLNTRGKPMWITAEQDKATHTPEESVKINLDYIRDLMEGASV